MAKPIQYCKVKKKTKLNIQNTKKKKKQLGKLNSKSDIAEGRMSVLK